MGKDTAKILILDGVDGSCADDLRKDNYEVEQTKAVGDNAGDVLAQYDAVVVRGATRLTEDVLEKASAGKLKLAVRVGAGVDNIDLGAATRLGIVVENTPGTNARAVMELTMAALLAMARNTVPAHMALKAGEWAKKQYAGSELSGKTLGLIGLGKIGQGVAALAKAFGMKIVGCDPVMTQERAAELRISLASPEDLYALSDYISLHASLNDNTRGMLNSDAFAAMKDGVCIVNCARAQLVDSKAIIQALDSGRARMYFTDVFEKEPPAADDPIVAHPNVLVTPHLGGSTEESSIEGARRAAEQIDAFLARGVAINAVNFQSGDPELRQWEDMARKLGSFMFQYLAGLGGFKRVNLMYHGELAVRQTNAVTSSFFVGFMKDVNSQANMVNAQHLAKDAGIEIVESRIEGERDALEIEVTTPKCTGKASGIIVGDKQVLQTLDDAVFDITFEDQHFLISHHSDVPGMVGIMGTVLGAHGVNIQKMGLRDNPGEQAMAMIATREQVPDDVMKEIEAAVNDKGGDIALRRIELEES